MATTCFEAVERIGMPEGRIVLSQCAIYLATSPKSNASYKAIGEAQALVRQTGDLPVPMHLRNAPTTLMQELAMGQAMPMTMIRLVASADKKCCQNRSKEPLCIIQGETHVSQRHEMIFGACGVRNMAIDTFSS